MSVSLVKVRYIAGFNMSGCFLPDSDVPATLLVTLADARESLASDLDDAAEQAESIGEDDTDWYAASIAGSAELVKSDRDGDITWTVERRGYWSTTEPDGYTYWIQRVTI